MVFRKLKKLRVKKLSKIIDESQVTDLLIKYWKDNDRAMNYLKKRFPDGDATGDFLKGIIELR